MVYLTESYLSISDYLFKLIYNEFPNFYPFPIQQNFIFLLIFSFQFRLTEADLFVNYSLIELQFQRISVLCYFYYLRRYFKDYFHFINRKLISLFVFCLKNFNSLKLSSTALNCFQIYC